MHLYEYYLYNRGDSLCHHVMARSQVEDGGDGLQIWRVSENVLNKQTRTAESVGPSAS